MELMFVDPHSLKENPNRSRRSKASAEADALLLATIQAVGIIQPPTVSIDAKGGNGLIIDAGHRRVAQAIAAGIEEIAVLVVDAAEDGGAMRSLAETLAHEHLNPVDQWRAIERLAALLWTEEAIASALALSVRQVRKLRLLASVLPAMLDHMAKGDMPEERQLRTIAAANQEEQKEVWKRHRPSKGNPQVSWWSIAQSLTKTRMYAKHASFGNDLSAAHGIAWAEDLFAPADEDSRYTTDVQAFLGAQKAWMEANLPERGLIAEVGSYGEVKLPPKAERVYGKPGKTDSAALYLDRDGRVQTVFYRVPAPNKSDGKSDANTTAAAKVRPDLTRKGIDMIGDFRTDALHRALDAAPIEDDTLMALLVLAFSGRNVSIQSGNADGAYGFARLDRHAATLFDAEGNFVHDPQTLRRATRLVLKDVLSCRRNRSNSGQMGLVAGQVLGADQFLPSMGTETFLSCLSRPALERSCTGTPIVPQARVKDTRNGLIEHFRDTGFVHPSARFATDPAELAAWVAQHAAQDEPQDQGDVSEAGEANADPALIGDITEDAGDAADEPEGWSVAAE
jgi:ParB family chromosome partitioning protein